MDTVLSEYPPDYAVAFWVVLGVLALLALAGAVSAWAAGRRGGGRRG